MSLKRYGLRFSVLAAALFLSACGSDGEGADQAAADSPAVETPAGELRPLSEVAIPQTVFEQLEESGIIPKLDRSDTLIGVDSNSNGIRDDVENYIATHFNETPAQEKAALQFARVLQEQIEVDLDDAAAIQAVLDRTTRSIVCLDSRFGDSVASNAEMAMNDIRAISSNTYDRMVGYLAFSEAVDGAVISLPRVGDGCDE